MSASHTSEKRWRSGMFRTPDGRSGEGVANRISNLSVQIIDGLLLGEEAYQQMQEMFAFAGGTVQGLADQLFFEDWSSRSTSGVHAVITVDVVANVIDSATVSIPGTAYANGLGRVIQLNQTSAGSGGRLTYDVVSGSITNVAVADAGIGYTNGTGITVLETPAPGTILETQANSTELAKTQDAVDAMTSIHEIYQASDNVAVAQEDRISKLRRMT